MKYLVMWARDNDYSQWHTSTDGHDNMEPQLYDSLDDVRLFLERVAVRCPDMVGRVYEVSGELTVGVELTKPVVEFTRT